MSMDYIISIRIKSGPEWSTTMLNKELLVCADLPDLGVLLNALDASPSIEQINVSRVITIPALTKLHKMTRKDLHIEESELRKVL